MKGIHFSFFYPIKLSWNTFFSRIINWAKYQGMSSGVLKW